MKKLFLVLFLISSSNIAHSGTVTISEKIEIVTNEECLLMVNHGNVWKFDINGIYQTDLKIIYNGYLYSVDLWDKDMKQGMINCNHKQSLSRE